MLHFNLHRLFASVLPVAHYLVFDLVQQIHQPLTSVMRLVNRQACYCLNYILRFANTRQVQLLKSDVGHDGSDPTRCALHAVLHTRCMYQPIVSKPSLCWRCNLPLHYALHCMIKNQWVQYQHLELCDTKRTVATTTALWKFFIQYKLLYEWQRVSLFPSNICHFVVCRLQSNHLPLRRGCPFPNWK